MASACLSIIVNYIGQASWAGHVQSEGPLREHYQP